MKREQLQEARKAKGLSVAEVAKEANISTRHYQYVELGERNVSLTVLKKIAKALDLKDISLF